MSSIFINIRSFICKNYTPKNFGNNNKKKSFHNLHNGNQANADQPPQWITKWTCLHLWNLQRSVEGPVFLQCVTWFSNGWSSFKNWVKDLPTVCVGVLKGIINTTHIPKYISRHSVIYLYIESPPGIFPDVSSTRLPIINIF